MQHHRMNLPENTATPSGSTFCKLQDDSISSWIGSIGAALLSAYIIHKLLVLLDFPVLSVFGSLWNRFVCLMPSPLVFAIRSSLNLPPPTDTDDASGQRAAQSEILRNVFGLDRSRTLVERQESEGIPAGLGNWDNSCYQNSILQVSLLCGPSQHTLHVLILTC